MVYGGERWPPLASSTAVSLLVAKFVLLARPTGAGPLSCHFLVLTGATFTTALFAFVTVTENLYFYLVFARTSHACFSVVVAIESVVCRGKRHVPSPNTFCDECFHPSPMRYVRSHRAQSLEWKTDAEKYTSTGRVEARRHAFALLTSYFWWFLLLAEHKQSRNEFGVSKQPSADPMMLLPRDRRSCC